MSHLLSSIIFLVAMSNMALASEFKSAEYGDEAATFIADNDDGDGLLIREDSRRERMERRDDDRGPWRRGNRWHRNWHWDRSEPTWWNEQIFIPYFAWGPRIRHGYWQCTSFDFDGFVSQGFNGYGRYRNEAAFNALQSCGDIDVCYVPPGYCKYRR